MKEEILREMMKNEGSKVFNMILRMLRQREDAEDVFQEVFTSFYEHLEDVKPEARGSYLYRIAYNKTLNRIAARKRKYKMLARQKQEPQVHKEPDTEKRNRLIRDSLARLKPVDALLIELQFYQKKSYREISDITGLSMGSVDGRLVRAKRRLREILHKMGIENLQEDRAEDVINK